MAGMHDVGAVGRGPRRRWGSFFDPGPRAWPDLVVSLGVVVVMVGATLLARWFELPGGYSPWYPPAGVVLTVLLLGGVRYAPAALVGRVAGLAVAHTELLRAEPGRLVAQSIAIVVVYSIGAALLRPWVDAEAGLRRFGWFVVVGVVATPFAAAAAAVVVDAVTLSAVGPSVASQIRTFWIGDAVAVATFVPAAVELWLWSRSERGPRRVTVGPLRRVEVVLQLIALVVVPTLVLTSVRGGLSPLVSLAVLPVLWVALRHDALVGSLGWVAVNASLAIAVRIHFGLSGNLVDLKVVMLAAALAGLGTSAVLSDLRRALVESAEREHRYAALVAATPATVVRFDRHGSIVEWQGDRPPVGDPVAIDALAARWPTFGPQALAEGLHRSLSWSIDDGTAASRWFITSVAPEARIDLDPDVLVTVTSDVTDLHEAEERLSSHIRNDPLTGLANQHHVYERLGALIARLEVDPSPVGLALVDIDGFRAVNARFGHHVGDLVLIDTARRIDRTIRAGDVAGRLGDDEFVVLFTSPLSVAEAEIAAERICREIRHVRVGDEPEPTVGASIGLAFASAVVPPGQLVDEARAALRIPQAAGGNGWATFDDEQRGSMEWSRRRSRDLRQAVDRNEFVLHYQPIVDLEDGSVTGAEALVRWQHPTDGLLYPVDFIELAERISLVGAVTDRVLAAAVAQLARWLPELDGRPFTLSVNVSAADLGDDRLLDRLGGLCEQHGVPAQRLRLELTETSVLADAEVAIAVLERLHDRGITIALDDFGTGYASLSLLRRLPVDVLKIDQTFVAGLPAATDAAVVRLVLGLARELGVDVVAEGIEEDVQRSTLFDAGCRFGQGYLFAKPMPADLFGSLLVEGATLGRVG